MYTHIYMYVHTCPEAQYRETMYAFKQEMWKKLDSK